MVTIVTIGRFHDNEIRNKLAKYLMTSMAKYIKNEELLSYTIHAINNAGPTVVSVGNYGNVVLNLLGHPSRRVRSAVRNSLGKFPEVVMATTVSTISDSNFPFNKSYTFDYKLGGATVNADFDVELFAGMKKIFIIFFILFIFILFFLLLLFYFFLFLIFNF